MTDPKEIVAMALEEVAQAWCAWRDSTDDRSYGDHTIARAQALRSSSPTCKQSLQVPSPEPRADGDWKHLVSDVAAALSRTPEGEQGR